MAIRSWLGRDGIHIRGSGLAAHSFRSDLALALAGGAVLDGAGGIGDLIGVADTRCMAAVDITPAAGRFITGTIITEEEASEA